MSSDEKHIKDQIEEKAEETEETSIKISLEREAKEMEKVADDIAKMFEDDFDEARKKINSTLKISDNLAEKIEDYISRKFASDLDDGTVKTLGLTADILQKVTSIRKEYINLLLSIYRTKKSVIGKKAGGSGSTHNRGGMTASKIKGMVKEGKKKPF